MTYTRENLTGENLRAWRRDLHLTAQAAADLLKISREWYGKLERGEQKVSAEVFLRFNGMITARVVPPQPLHCWSYDFLFYSGPANSRLGEALKVVAPDFEAALEKFKEWTRFPINSARFQGSRVHITSISRDETATI